MKIINYSAVRRPPVTDAETDNPLRLSSDSDVIGFADKPYPRDEPPVAAAEPRPEPEPYTQTIPPPPPNNDTDDHTNNDNNTNNNTNSNSTTQLRKRLRGWRDGVDTLLCLSAFIIPWGTGMAFAWGIYSKAPRDDVPYEVRIITILSTTEVSSMFFFFFLACLSACISPLERFFKSNSDTRPQGEPLSIAELFFRLWLAFILLTPVVSGIWVTDRSKHFRCDFDLPKCIIGQGLIIGIGVYRFILMYLFVAAILLFDDWFVKRAVRSQDRMDEEHARQRGLAV